MVTLVRRIEIVPVPKPRMTRSDRFRKRACTERYWDYKDKLKLLLDAKDIPEHYWLVFKMPMSKSWSAKKRSHLNGTPHKQKPDKDNLEKGFLDALFEDDSMIWTGGCSKIWSEVAKIEIYQIEAFHHVQCPDSPPRSS